MPVVLITISFSIVNMHSVFELSCIGVNPGPVPYNVDFFGPNRAGRHPVAQNFVGYIGLLHSANTRPEAIDINPHAFLLRLRVSQYH
ncbi:MAG: hypothetical protein HUJ51_03305 [Eggerthellaceae bacterium]|nr:hypothetical protein [Eggerthellaceae bacterium]